MAAGVTTAGATVWLRIEDVRLAGAVTSTLLAAGASEALDCAALRGDGSDDGIVEWRDRDSTIVTDQCDEPADVLVVKPTAWACHVALAAWLARQTSLIAADELADVIVALDMVAHGMVGVASRVRELAAAMPKVTDRQLDVLRALMAGCSNRQAGRLLLVSEATVKREVAALSATMGLYGRSVLVSAGFGLGMVPLTLRTHPAAAHLFERAFRLPAMTLSWAPRRPPYRVVVAE